MDKKLRAKLPVIALAATTLAVVAVTPGPSTLAAQQGAGPRTPPTATSPCDDTPPPQGATLTPSRDLYCVFLTARPGLEDLAGRLELRTPHSPFGVAVNAAGNHLYEGILTLDGLPDPATLGDYNHIVAWLATPLFDTVRSLGPVTNGTRSIGEISLNKFMLLVTAEARPDAPEWEGPAAPARDVAQRPHVAARPAGVPARGDRAPDRRRADARPPARTQQVPATAAGPAPP